jgi:6-phosphogluconate dehydrogenase
MKIGFSGLGKMGSQMVNRLIDQGHEVMVVNRSPEPAARAVELGAVKAESLTKMVEQLNPVIVWLMLPPTIAAQQLDLIYKIAPAGSIIIDGGNSDYRNSIIHAKRASQYGLHFIDVGTSGGILGLKNGFSLMVGGNEEAVKNITPILDSLSKLNGWKHLGPAGSGHFVKMVHNAIEYGMMESYAEGYRLLKEGPFKEIDLASAGRVWQNGSIVESLLNELTVQALEENPQLKGIAGMVAESGEARWAIETAKGYKIDMPAIETSFNVRLKSQAGEVNFATKLLAAMRNKFGGHEINPH